jgi:SAM-dependent methyltransferase
MIKIEKTLKKFFNTLGYDIRRLENRNLDLNLYPDIFPKDSIVNKRFYNIGAGAFRHPFWTNIDLKSEWYSPVQKNRDFINFDLFSLKKLPIPDNTAEIVYSSHTVEHINDEAAQNMFNESYRILKKGGIFRFATPNINLEYRAYKDNDKNYFYWYYGYSQDFYKRIKCKIVTKDTPIQQMFLYHFAAQVSELHMASPLPKISDEELDKIFSTLDYEDALNYCTSKCSIDVQRKHSGNHMNWWNEKKAFRMLKEAGFEDRYGYGYGQSFSPVLRNISLFDNTHPKISLYIEAIK